MSRRNSRVVLCVLWVAACAAAPVPSPDSPVPPVAPAESTKETSVGTRRMVEILREISNEVTSGNSAFLGRGQIRELRERLAALPESASPRERWQLQLALGRNELRTGEVRAAVVAHLAAYRLLEGLDELPIDRAMETVFELGVAYLRLGETDNCALRHNADSCIFPIRDAGVHQLREGSENALPYFTEVLRKSQENSLWYLRAQWLLNVAHMTLGQYPDRVPENYRLSPALFASDEAFPRFRDIAPRLGLNAFDLSGGAVADDFDGDGDLDVITTTWDPAGPMHYYRNDGAGRFVARAEAAGLAGLAGGLNLVQADYDNDGDVDLLVLRGAWLGRAGAQPNSLLRNDGRGSFSDVTYEAGLAEPFLPTQTAGWADYDNDGDLDVYVGNEHDSQIDAPGQLFRNEGNGTFRDVARQAGVENRRFAKGVTWGDYDGDRFADLFVSNRGQDNRLYHNNGDGTFSDVAQAKGVTLPVDSFPAWFWDFDNDGNLDLFVSSYAGDVADVAANYLGFPPRFDRARLYRGDGKGGFRDVAIEQNLKRVTLPMGSNFGDLDNDGFLDFYLGTGYPSYEGVIPNLMYRNRGGTGFSDVTTAGGFGHLQKGHAVFFADLDDDGDQDVFEQMGGAFPGDGFGDALYENPGFGRHWIKIGLVGVRSNRAGVGARIRLEVADGGRMRSIYRHVNSGGSFGCNPLRQEIGVGEAMRIASLEIFWPTTGKTQTLHDVAVDRTIEIVEELDSSAAGGAPRR